MKNPQTTIAPTFLTHIISAIDGVNMHPNVLQRQLILMGGFEHCALFSGETTAEKLQNILDRLLADKNDWTNDFGDKHEFQKALEKDVEVAKIAIASSLLACVLSF